MDLSVILCTWNNADRLAETLGYIATCRIPTELVWDLVVVNNNCSDATDEVVEDYSVSLPIVLVHEPRQGLSRAKNAGLAAAKGDLIIFTDDDVCPCETWVATYWEAFREKGDDYYYGGPVQSEFEGRPPRELFVPYAPYSVKGVDWGDRPRELKPSEPCFVSANWACPASAAKGLDGFDETMGLNASPGRVRVGEETDFMCRLRSLGLRAWYLPGAGIRHFVPKSKTTLRHIAARRQASGYQRARYGVDHDLARVPTWMYKVLAKRVIHVIRGLARREWEAALNEYMELRALLGRIIGLRDRLEANRGQQADALGGSCRHV